LPAFFLGATHNTRIFKTLPIVANIALLAYIADATNFAIWNCVGGAWASVPDGWAEGTLRGNCLFDNSVLISRSSSPIMQRGQIS
jgi:hypothetical protein